MFADCIMALSDIYFVRPATWLRRWTDGVFTNQKQEVSPTQWDILVANLVVLCALSAESHNLYYQNCENPAGASQESQDRGELHEAAGGRSHPGGVPMKCERIKRGGSAICKLLYQVMPPRRLISIVPIYERG